jgi:hypothetical protein
MAATRWFWVARVVAVPSAHQRRRRHRQLFLHAAALGEIGPHTNPANRLPANE